MNNKTVQLQTWLRKNEDVFSWYFMVAVSSDIVLFHYFVVAPWEKNLSIYSIYSIYKSWHIQDHKRVPSPSLTVCPWKVTFPIGKDHLPSTIFQGRTVKLPGLYSTPGTSSSASSWRTSSSSLSSESVLGVGLPHLRRSAKNPRNLTHERTHGTPRTPKKNLSIYLNALYSNHNLGSVGIRSKHHFLDAKKQVSQSQRLRTLISQMPTISITTHFQHCYSFHPSSLDMGKTYTIYIYS